MNFVAWRMLTGDRAKYLGLIFSIAFATFLIAQQASIFAGLMLRTASQYPRRSRRLALDHGPAYSVL